MQDTLLQEQIKQHLTPTPADGVNAGAPINNSINEFDLTLNTTLKHINQAHQARAQEDQNEDIIAYGYRELSPFIKLHKLFINNEHWEYCVAESILKLKNEIIAIDEATSSFYEDLEELSISDPKIAADIFKSLKEKLAPDISSKSPKDTQLTKSLYLALQLAGQRTVLPHQELVRKFISSYTPFIQIEASIEEIYLYYQDGKIRVEYICPLYVQHATNKKAIPLNINLKCNAIFSSEGLVETQTIYSLSKEYSPTDQALMAKLAEAKTFLEAEQCLPENHEAPFIELLIKEKLTQFIGKKIIAYKENPSDTFIRDELVSLFFTLTQFHELPGFKKEVASLATQIFTLFFYLKQFDALFNNEFRDGTGAVNFAQETTSAFLNNASIGDQRIIIENIIASLHDLIAKGVSNPFTQKKIHSFMAFLVAKLCHTITSENDPYITQLTEKVKNAQINLAIFLQAYESKDTPKEQKSSIQKAMQCVCRHLSENTPPQLTFSTAETCAPAPQSTIDLFYSLARFHFLQKSEMRDLSASQLTEPFKQQHDTKKSLHNILIELISHQHLHSLLNSETNAKNFLSSISLIENLISEIIPQLYEKACKENQLDTLIKLIFDFTNFIRVTYPQKYEAFTLAGHLELALLEKFKLTEPKEIEFFDQRLVAHKNDRHFQIEDINLIYLKLSFRPPEGLKDIKIKVNALKSLAEKNYHFRLEQFELKINELIQLNQLEEAKLKLVEFKKLDEDLRAYLVIKEQNIKAFSFNKFEIALKRAERKLAKVQQKTSAGSTGAKSNKLTSVAAAPTNTSNTRRNSLIQKPSSPQIIVRTRSASHVEQQSIKTLESNLLGKESATDSSSDTDSLSSNESSSIGSFKAPVLPVSMSPAPEQPETSTSITNSTITDQATPQMQPVAATQQYSRQHILATLYKDFVAQYSIEEALRLVPLTTSDSNGSQKSSMKTPKTAFDVYLDSRNSTLSIKWNGFLKSLGIKTTWTKIDAIYNSHEEFQADAKSITPIAPIDQIAAPAPKPKTKSTYGCLPCLFNSKKSTPVEKPQAVNPTEQAATATTAIPAQNLKAAKTAVSFTQFMRYLFGIEATHVANISQSSAATPTLTPGNSSDS